MRSARTMSLLTSSSDVLRQPTHLPQGTVSFVGLIDSDGSQYELNPTFGGAIAEIVEALSAGKLVHIDSDEELVSAQRAAELLGVSRPTIYAWQDRNLLGRDDNGGKRLVPLHDIERYIRERGERANWRAQVRAIAKTEDTDEAADRAAQYFTGNLDLAADVEAEDAARPGRKGR